MAAAPQEMVQIEFNKGAIGKAFRQDQPAIMEHILAMTKMDALAMQQQLTETGNYSIGMPGVFHEQYFVQILIRRRL
jgi:hypothetical protein